MRVPQRHVPHVTLTHLGTSLTNSAMNSAAMMAPPPPSAGPVLLMSATLLSISLRYGACSGSRHSGSLCRWRHRINGMASSQSQRAAFAKQFQAAKDYNYSNQSLNSRR